MLDPRAPITGVCGYSTDWELGWNLSPLCCLRVDCNLPGRGDIKLYHYLNEPLAPAGTFRFRTDPIEGELHTQCNGFRGTTVLFARLCIANPPGNHPVPPHQISNIRAEPVELVDFARR